MKLRVYSGKGSSGYFWMYEVIDTMPVAGPQVLRAGVRFTWSAALSDGCMALKRCTGGSR